MTGWPYSKGKPPAEYLRGVLTPLNCSQRSRGVPVPRQLSKFPHFQFFSTARKRGSYVMFITVLSDTLRAGSGLLSIAGNGRRFVLRLFFMKERLGLNFLPNAMVSTNQPFSESGKKKARHGRRAGTM